MHKWSRLAISGAVQLPDGAVGFRTPSETWTGSYAGTVLIFDGARLARGRAMDKRIAPVFPLIDRILHTRAAANARIITRLIDDFKKL
jgi:hypothetical protein